MYRAKLDTLIGIRAGQVGLAKHQEGWEKGGVTAWTWTS